MFAESVPLFGIRAIITGGNFGNNTYLKRYKSIAKNFFNNYNYKLFNNYKLGLFTCKT